MKEFKALPVEAQPKLPEDPFKELKDKILAQQKFIYNMCKKTLGQQGSPEIVESVANEALFKALRNASQYKEESALNTWLGTIVRNTVFDYLRKVKKTLDTGKNVVNMDEIDILENRENPEEELVNREEAELKQKAFREALGKLSEKDRELIEASLKLSHTEMAKQQGLSGGGLRKNLFNARKRLAELMGNKDFKMRT